VFWERALPSANVTLVRGVQPVLVDSGFGSDVEDLGAWLDAQGVRPGNLRVVNTHFHSDHVGGNAFLRRAYGARIGAHAWEAALVNRRSRDACSAEWLDQPVEPYRVDDVFVGGEVLDAGGATLEVVHAPGHTLGHVAFLVREERALILGDVVHARDVAWLNPFVEGRGAIDRLIGTVERLLTLGARAAFTGHGPPLLNPDAEFRAALGKLQRWLREPEFMYWHGAKRTFAYALMLRGGLARDEVEPYLLAREWVRDYALHAFRVTPVEFVRLLLAEMERSGAARWEENVLRAGLPHRSPPRAWLDGVPRPPDWPS